MAALMWQPLVPAAVTAIALMMVPGLVVGACARLRGLELAAVAPAASIGVVASSAVVAELVGIRFSPLPVAAGTVVAALLAAAAARAVRRARTIAAERTARTGRPEPARRRRGLLGGVAVLIATVLLARHVLRILGAPDALSQSIDVVFHLNAVAHILETGDGSSRTLGGISLTPGAEAFYPAGWHDLTALTAQLTGADVLLATNAITLITGSLVWALGCAYLVTSLRGTSAVGILVAGVAAASTTTFPMIMLRWGVIYPNYLGYALLPLALGVAANLFGLGVRAAEHRPAGWTGIVLLVGPGIGFAHPNALLSLVVLAAPIVIARLVAELATGRSRTVIAALVAVLAAGVALFLGIRPSARASIWEPVTTPATAAWEFLTQSPNQVPPAWIVAFLVAAGAVTALALRQDRWLVGTWLVTGVLWIVAGGLPVSGLRTLLTGTWYNDSYRLAALLAVPVPALLALGVDGLVRPVLARLVQTPLGRGDRARSRDRGARHAPPAPAAPAPAPAPAPAAQQGRSDVGRRGPPVLPAVGLGLVATVVVGALAPTSAAVTAAVDRAAREFRLTESSLLLTTDEAEVLAALDEHVPAGGTILTDPWDGSSLAYALEGYDVTAMTAVGYPSGPYAVVNTGMDEVLTDPAVCDAVQELDAYWYLEFENTLGLGAHHHAKYAGLDGLETLDVVEPLHVVDDVGLYEVTTCGPVPEDP